MLRILLASLPLSLLIALGGCQTDSVGLTNPATKQEAQCGPYWRGGWNGPLAAAEQEIACVEQYRLQGFERVSR